MSLLLAIVPLWERALTSVLDFLTVPLIGNISILEALKILALAYIANVASKIRSGQKAREEREKKEREASQ